MKSLVEKKIEEIYHVALNLGLDKASDNEKRIFKNSLNEIVSVVIDDIRTDIIQMLYNKNNNF